MNDKFEPGKYKPRKGEPPALCRWSAATILSLALLVSCPLDRASSQEAVEPHAKPAAAGAAADLDALQEQVSARFKRFEELLLRLAGESGERDARRVELLRKAIARSKDRRVALQLARLVDLLGKDRLSAAISEQAAVMREIDELLQLLLSENRDERQESLQAQLRAYLEQVSKLIREQKSVLAQTERGAPAERLSGQQQALANKTGKLASEMRADDSSAEEESGDDSSKDKESESGNEQGSKRDQSGKSGSPSGAPQQSQGGAAPPSDSSETQPARERLQAAQERMREAQAKLDEAQHQPAAERQEEALRELQQAKAELQKILRQLREEEVARMLAMLEERFRSMLLAQKEVNQGTLQVAARPKQQRSRSDEIEAGRLSRAESGITLEADKALALLREDGSAVAMVQAVSQLRDDMRQVTERLAAVDVGELTQTLEQDIVVALEELIAAVQTAREQNAQQQNSPSPADSEPAEPPLVDQLAELRVLRSLQLRVNRRTQQYTELIEGEQAVDPALLEALAELAQREERIAGAARDLATGNNQ